MHTVVCRLAPTCETLCRGLRAWARDEREVASIMGLSFPALTTLPLGRYVSLLGEEATERTLARFDELVDRLRGRVVWNVSSTAVGGGVAELVRSLLAYARGLGVDARWAVIDAPPEFFVLTKRLHNAIHGSFGDGSPLGAAERALYEHVNADNAAELLPLVSPGDIVIVHDPQPAAMIRVLLASGAHVIWRCHIGHDSFNGNVEEAWSFLAPYIRDAHAYVFSRATYVPTTHLDASRALVIPPTIDPFSPKNQRLDSEAVRAILARAGFVESAVKTWAATFMREDGTPGRVDRRSEIVRENGPPPETTPLVVQVSRWDHLKDPLGVLRGFARATSEPARAAHLVLAGPQATSVCDDPEGAAVLSEVIDEWRRLPDHVRARVHLASIPTMDVDENAAIVNALQRHASVIVQKSLHEGFGLTVAEGMWKSKPIIASAVGGIQDQIEDGVQGLLLNDPTDLDEFANALDRVLEHPVRALRMGERGHERVLERYLGFASLLRYGALIESLDGRRVDAISVATTAHDAHLTSR